LLILSASVVGAPVSTTHVVATSIMGIGYSEHPRAVRWKKAVDIAKTWVITIPASALTAIVCYALARIILGQH
jgi:PiT family inorganic phosphate transporter